jgi:FkbM family methyltransferase
MFKLRELAERLSRGIVLNRRLPREFGSLRVHVSPEGGGLKYWSWNLGSIAPDLLRAVELFVRAGSVVWDVGANMGLFTFAAAQRTGPSGSVLGIEPDVDNVRLLNRTRNGLPETCGPVEILPVALNRDGGGFVRLVISERARAANAMMGFGSSQMGGAREVRVVPAYRLDDLLKDFPAPSVVKVDVEGAEVEVLAGGAQLFQRCRPELVLEVSRASSEYVATMLGSFGYKFFDAEAAKPFERSVETPPWSCLAVHRDRVRQFSSISG